MGRLFRHFKRRIFKFLFMDCRCFCANSLGVLFRNEVLIARGQKGNFQGYSETVRMR